MNYYLLLNARQQHWLKLLTGQIEHLTVVFSKNTHNMGGNHTIFRIEGELDGRKL